MTIGDKIENEKLQHDINTEAAKLPVILLEKFDKYEYLTREKM